MVPMCRSLIEPALLTSAEKEWLNGYHAEVFEKTKGFFGGRSDEGARLAMQYVKRETQRI